MKTQIRRLAVTAALVCCCTLTSCGTERAGAPATAASPASPHPSATGGTCAPAGPEGPTDEDTGEPPDTTSDDQGGQELPDTTSDDQGGQELPDTTSDDQGDPGLPDTTSDDQELPDTTSDDQGGAELPDTASDDQGPPPVDTEEDADLSDRWFSMTREFVEYLRTGAPKADAALAVHVHSVSVCTADGGARTLARVRVDYGVEDDGPLRRTAQVFAHWRQSLYGDHGHVEVLAPAKMTAEQDW
ncbi:hypothetical protein C3489_34075 [Streptomyces sp. Ru71]|uniref:hypothetical protein n=1 Tax=Streptomyces sp. Ru71 TaxID=2080746 RepID=UPI000CDD014C|nr:hypothetical protein [Streptomyces sp. Ru71]POX45514.1 hypothetical protein C3489_34075 [Streptomyces sp. Ru71]